MGCFDFFLNFSWEASVALVRSCRLPSYLQLASKFMEGLPGVLWSLSLQRGFPSGVQLTPLVSSEGLCGRCCLALLVTCPIHLHRLRMMMVPMLSWLQRARCWLEMVSGQSTCRIYLRFSVWKVNSLLRSLSVILQRFKPYSRVESTRLWYSISLVLVLYWDDFHTFFSITHK